MLSVMLAAAVVSPSEAPAPSPTPTVTVTAAPVAPAVEPSEAVQQRDALIMCTGLAGLFGLGFLMVVKS